MTRLGFMLLVLASHLVYAAAAPKPFKIAPLGPHGWKLVRAAPVGPNTELAGYYEKLYFELVQKKSDLVLYPFLVPPDQKGFLVPGSPRKDLPEYRANARFPANKRDIKLNAYLDGGAIHAIFGGDEVTKLGIKTGDPLVVIVTVIHESMSKEAIFNVEQAN